MSAAEILQEAAAAGVRVTVDGEHLSLEAPAPPSPELIERLRAAKPALIAYLRRPPVPLPLVMRDGRRHWTLPPAGNPNAAVDELITRARAVGVVLVADGTTLHVTAPKGRLASELPALARHAAAIVRSLHRASDTRLRAGRHQGAAMTGPDGRPVLIPAGWPVPLPEAAHRPEGRPELRVVTSADRQANVERMLAAGTISDDIEREAIMEIDGRGDPR